MNAYINGTEVALSGDQEALGPLLTRLGYAGEHFAVAVNGTFVPRSERSARPIAANDRIEVLAPMVGG